MSEPRHTNLPRLKAIRRDLRNHATQAERALWQMLKGRRLGGRKFRRQHSIESFVLDVYCPSEKLAIELDGAVHGDPLRATYDAERTEALGRLGVRVLRFRNEAVLNTPDTVLAAITEAFSAEPPAGTTSPPADQ